MNTEKNNKSEVKHKGVWGWLNQSPKPFLRTMTSMNTEQNNKSEVKYKGVGGWLSLFIISLCIINPLIMVFGLISSYRYLSILFLIISVWTVGLICFSIYAGISLWKIRPRAVKIAKTFLLLCLVEPIISIWLPVLIGAGQELMIEVAKESYGPIFYVITWYSYLSKSKRVKATYLAKT